MPLERIEDALRQAEVENVNLRAERDRLRDDVERIERARLVAEDHCRANGRENDRLREALTGLLRYSTSSEYGTEGKKARTVAVDALALGERDS